MRGSTLHFQTPLENMAAARLTFDKVLPNLLTVNDLRVARALLAGLARRTNCQPILWGIREAATESKDWLLGRLDSNLGSA